MLLVFPSALNGVLSVALAFNNQTSPLSSQAVHQCKYYNHALYTRDRIRVLRSSETYDFLSVLLLLLYDPEKPLLNYILEAIALRFLWIYTTFSIVHFFLMLVIGYSFLLFLTSDVLLNAGKKKKEIKRISFGRIRISGQEQQCNHGSLFQYAGLVVVGRKVKLLMWNLGLCCRTRNIFWRCW